MPTRPVLYRWLAGLWAALMLLVAWDQVQFWQSSRLDTDVLALLPPDEHQPIINTVARKLTDENGRQIVVLVGAPDWDQTRAAATRFRAEMTQHSDVLAPSSVTAASLEEAMAFYIPARAGLLTPAQRDWLGQASANALGDAALMRLYQPTGPRLTDWHADPLGLWQDWWLSRAAESNVRPRDGELWLSAQGREWVLVLFDSKAGTFAVSGATPISNALQAARQAAAHDEGQTQVIAAGVPLYAEAAAAQANDEMSTIGIGSMLAVLLLIWLAFRALRPIVLVGLSLVAGCAVALSVTALIFPKVHLLTLVFGSSLVGVAEDYGFHYFSARQGKGEADRYRVLEALLPGLLLALGTSVLAYLALGIAPFPGLQQMAVFSATGLLAAFLTVVCWFPWMDRGPLHQTTFAARVANNLQRWPRLQATRNWLVFGLCLGGLTLAGLVQLRSQDDIRQLYSAPAQLLAEQVQINELLGQPSPAQFFLVRGDSAQQLLQHEEALGARLTPLVQRGVLGGYRAVSDWLPSRAMQERNAELVRRAEQQAWSAVTRATGQMATQAAPPHAALDAETWLASPASKAIRGQWLGDMDGQSYSLVMLRGVQQSNLAEIEAAGDGLTGVQWVNRTAQISDLIARYRDVMLGYLLAGYTGVLLLLLWRFRRQAWRALMPTILGTLMTLSIFGWIGEPIQLFTVLALLLLLGMGVDYGIFLLEHPGDGSAWVAVALAGVSTLLSFGLLGLSATPALRAFGLTMLIGEISIWILTPFFRPTAPTTQPHGH